MVVREWPDAEGQRVPTVRAAWSSRAKHLTTVSAVLVNASRNGAKVSGTAPEDATARKRRFAAVAGGISSDLSPIGVLGQVPLVAIRGIASPDVQ